MGDLGNSTVDFHPKKPGMDKEGHEGDFGVTVEELCSLMELRGPRPWEDPGELHRHRNPLSQTQDFTCSVSSTSLDVNMSLANYITPASWNRQTFSALIKMLRSITHSQVIQNRLILFLPRNTNGELYWLLCTMQLVPMGTEAFIRKDAKAP